MPVLGTDVKPKRPMPRPLRIALTVTLILYGTLLVSWIVPIVNLFLFGFSFYGAYLWAYSGFVVVTVVFVGACCVGRKVLANSKQCSQFATLAAASAFALVWMALVTSSLSFRYDPQLVGYRLHTRLWLNADKVRHWAQNLELSEGGEVLKGDSWRPLTLRMTGLPFGGRVYVDAQTRDVTVEQGGPLCGHWGAFITDKERQWQGEHPYLDEPRLLKVEAGVWVWSTED